MLQITRESADRAAALVAEAGRDLGLTVTELMDHLDRIGGLARLVLLLASAASFDDEDMSVEQVVEFARKELGADEGRRLPWELSDVVIGAEKDSTAPVPLAGWRRPTPEWNAALDALWGGSTDHAANARGMKHLQAASHLCTLAFLLLPS